MTKKINWYDVCNDYSLEARPDKPGDLRHYTPHKVANRTEWHHTAYNELHYVSISLEGATK